MDGNALEQAVALRRAPNLRFLVHERPLASGIGEVVALAAATQPLLLQRAEALKLPQDELLELARFYLQQALFEAEGDAYRVLGVAADAELSLIRQHHRWLQQWLHPDRHNDQWGSAYSQRLNQAWAQLRTPGARKRHDARRHARLKRLKRSEPAAVGVPAGAPRPAPAGRWRAQPVSVLASPRRLLLRTGVGLSILVCLGLLGLAWMHERAPGPPSVAAPVAAPESAASAESGALAWHAARRVAPRDQAPVRAGSGMGRQAAQRVVARELPTLDAKPAVRSAPGSVQTVRPRAAATAAVSSVTDMPEAASNPIMAEVANAEIAGFAPDAITPVAPTPQPVAMPVTVAVTELFEPEVSLQHVAIANVASAASAAKARPVVSASVLLARTQRARARVRGLVAWLRRADDAPPEWPAGPLRPRLQHVRSGLRQRIGREWTAHFELQPPHWRVAPDMAQVQADYQVARDRTMAERGRLLVRMVWRHNGWRLARVELDPGR